MPDPAMNKAKCLLCGDIIESKHLHDHAFCRCGNVSVCGGLINPVIRGTNYSQVGSVEEDDHSIKGEYKPNEKDGGCQGNKQVVRDGAFYELERLLVNLHDLPPKALDAPVTHRDYSVLIGRLLAILRAF